MGRKDNRHRRKSPTGAKRTLSTPERVVPKHWHPAYARIGAGRNAIRIRRTGIPLGEVHLAVREVPQSAPNQADNADDRDHQRHQGPEPVRFSNGQQRT